MTKEKDRPDKPEESAEKSEKSGLNPLQVLAAGLAAITAAFLGSSLGVYGTVLGAGVISVATTVGSEVYLRSMHRTREAARKAKELTDSKLRITRTLPVTAEGDDRQQTATHRLPVAGAGESAGGERTVYIPRPGTGEQAEQPPAESRSRWWKRRWPLVVGTSVLAFVIGMLVLTGFELTTGKPVSGGEGSTLSQLVGGGGRSGGGDQPEAPTGGDEAPVTETGRKQPPPDEGGDQDTSTPDPTRSPESTTKSSEPSSSDPPTSSKAPDPTEGGGQGQADQDAKPKSRE